MHPQQRFVCSLVDQNKENPTFPAHAAYTHAARGEAEDAEASGRLMLAIIDRHAAVLHLPLTFTLAEASRRLLAAAGERSSRPAPEGVHVEALGAAVTKLSFARPTQAVKPGAGGVAAAAGGGGGWCAFGDDILAAFAAAGGRDSGGDVLSEVRELALGWETGTCSCYGTNWVLLFFS